VHSDLLCRITQELRKRKDCQTVEAENRTIAPIKHFGQDADRQKDEQQVEV